MAALAVGIGSNTAIFSVVNTVLLKPPPFPEPERIVMFMNTSPQGQGGGASPAKFNHWREQSSVVRDVSAFRTNVVNLTGGDVPEQLRAAQVSANFFRLFGAPLIMGRGFTAEEDRPRGPAVALISEGLWRRRFASDPKISGRTIELGGDPHSIVGVVGSSFDLRDFGRQPDVFVPFQIDPNTSDQGHYFQAYGRLNDGVTMEQARARIVASAAEYLRKYPRSLGERGGRDPLRSRRGSRFHAFARSPWPAAGWRHSSTQSAAPTPPRQREPSAIHEHSGPARREATRC